jgi:predicted O-linked N-acetylglucosamine transferase (SPINDLY family)
MMTTDVRHGWLMNRFCNQVNCHLQQMTAPARAAALLQAQQQHVQQQLAAAQQLTQEVEALKQENLEAWRIKYELESQMAAYKANLEGMQRQGSSMQKVRCSCPRCLFSPQHSTYVSSNISVTVSIVTKAWQMC